MTSMDNNGDYLMPCTASHLTYGVLHFSDALQCNTVHLVAITTITAHATTTIRITDFAMKLQRALKALYTKRKVIS